MTAQAVAAASTLARGAWRVWRRDATVYRHLAKWLLLPNFLDPVFFLLAMGLGLGQYLRTMQDTSYIDFIAPGLMASSVMYTASFENTWNVTFKLTQSYTYAAMVATPLGAGDIVLGEVLWGATRAALTGVIFFVVLVATGLVSSPWAALMPVAAFLVGLNFSAMGVFAGSTIVDVAFWGYYYTLVITPMFLLSGIFFPLDNFPGWAQAAAWLMPLYNGASLLRSLGSGQVGWPTLGHAAMLVVMPCFLLPLTVRQFRRRLVA